MNDFATTYGHFMNALKKFRNILKYSVSRTINGNTKKVVKARWSTK